MKPEEQRIAIAEACGWKFSATKDKQKRGYLYAPEGSPLPSMCRTVTIWKDGTLGGASSLPDYLNSLDAMHEAVLECRDKLNGYTMELRRIIQRDCDSSEFYAPDCRLIADLWFYHATAAQRAEAFLRTLNLWKE